MLLRYFNSSYLSRLISAFLLTLLLWIPAFIIPPKVLPQEYVSPLFNLYLSIPIPNGQIHVLLAFLITIVTALIINHIATEFGLSEKTSYMSAFLYLLFSSSMFEFTRMSPIIFINLLGALYLQNAMRLSHTSNSIYVSFNGGLFIGLMTLFYPPMAFLFIVQLMALMLNRINNIRAFLSAFLGFILPFIYLFTYYFWNGSLAQMFYHYTESFRLHSALFYPDDLISEIIMGIIVVFTVAAVWKEYIKLNKRKISKRRNISMAVYMLIMLFLIYVFYSNSFKLFLLLFIPLTIVVNDYLRFVKRKKLAEIAIFVLTLLSLFNQYFQLYYAS